MATKADIRTLFEPESVAVIGASGDPGKIGHSILKNIIDGGYRGEVFPVNPRGGVILGLNAYQRIEDIGRRIDLATIVIPAKNVPEAVKSCAGCGVKHVQIITSGFSEAGNREAETEIARTAQAAGMRVLGPNIFGLYSSNASLNATFSATEISPGPVAILTQSGALGIAMIGKTAVDNIGLSAVVSLGNKSDIDESDLLDYLMLHEPTRVVLLYIEGVKNGAALVRTLKRATALKPVVVIKSGRSRRGAMAAASHTGSLAGSDDVFDAIMRQCGVLRAESVEEAFNWCKFLAFNPAPAGNRTVIVTNGGGIGVMASDACEKYGIGLFDDQETLKKTFEPVTPAFGSVRNPVDLTGGAGSNDYRDALMAAAASNSMDATIALYCETASFDSENLGPMISETAAAHVSARKPIAFAAIGGNAVESVISRLKKQNVPVFGDVYAAVSCLGAANRQSAGMKESAENVEEALIDVPEINRIIGGALAEGRSFLLAHESAGILHAAGVRAPRSVIARSIREAIDAAESIGYPVVMKIVSRNVLHKSDAGGVALDILSNEEVIDAYEAIMKNVREYKPGAVIDGIEVCSMARPGTEIIIGSRIDPSFGPIVMCGLGGIYVEVMKDVAFRALPISLNEADSMIREIRSFPLLLGVRGEKRKDIEWVIDTIIRVGTIIMKCDMITDIEINPVVVYDQGDGGMAVDARIIIAKTREDLK